MAGAAVEAARALQYTSVGSIDFFVDDDGNFYVTRVNTGLEIAHALTEMVAGVDIVKEQIRIAAGEPLSLSQHDVTVTGHAIGCRLYAADAKTLAPSPGVIRVCTMPGGPGVRVDSLAYRGCTISQHSDSLIGTIVAHGRDRQEAVARMRRALGTTIVEGVPTSLPLQVRILGDPVFDAGRTDDSVFEQFIHRAATCPAAGTADLDAVAIAV
jgi:acetyl-CoA carboxylase biotin carboxylase subunit